MLFSDLTSQLGQFLQEFFLIFLTQFFLPLYYQFVTGSVLGYILFFKLSIFVEKLS
jgi:hypothetical protein